MIQGGAIANLLVDVVKTVSAGVSSYSQNAGSTEIRQQKQSANTIKIILILCCSYSDF